MIKLKLYCDCGYEADVDDLDNLDGFCPMCCSHHGNAWYGTEMKPKDFVEELSKMDESAIAKYAFAIKTAAEDLINNGEW